MATNKEAQRRFKAKHPDAAAKAAKKYRQKNPDKVKETGKKYRKKYYTDPTYRLTVLMRSRILSALKGRKLSQNLKSSLGCSIDDLKKHLERQFQPGMTWENQGEWHIDHIIPCSKFDLTDPKQQKACFHYTNLQPLWGKENIKKGASMDIKTINPCNSSLARTQAEKEMMINNATIAYGKFMDALGLQWHDDPHGKDTPRRVAKAWINDLISGCVNPLDDVKSFPNTEGYTGLVCQTKIPVVSLCCHHHLAFVGVAHVAYIPGKSKDDMVIGLSKLNRIVDWYARRPNIQESLTKQIHDKVDELCVGNRGVAVVIESQHNCVRCRGVKHDSVMKTSQLSGYFHTNEVGTRVEFFNLIDQSRHS